MSSRQDMAKEMCSRSAIVLAKKPMRSSKCRSGRLATGVPMVMSRSVPCLPTSKANAASNAMYRVAPDERATARSCSTVGVGTLRSTTSPRLERTGGRGRVGRLAGGTLSRRTFDHHATSSRIAFEAVAQRCWETA